MEVNVFFNIMFKLENYNFESNILSNISLPPSLNRFLVKDTSMSYFTLYDANGTKICTYGT